MISTSCPRRRHAHGVVRHQHSDQTARRGGLRHPDRRLRHGDPDPSPGLIRLVRAAAQSTRRVAAICLGAFILGDAGLLNGRRATTHWRYASILQERFPSCQVDLDKIFIEDGIWTSAGMTAGIDLVIGMIERDHGNDLARAVAKSMVLLSPPLRRPVAAFGASRDRRPRRPRAGAMNYARANLRSRLSIEELADAAHLSPRQFTRLFRMETGTTPAKAVEMLRVEAAKLMLEQSRLPIEQIAREVGSTAGSGCGSPSPASTARCRGRSAATPAARHAVRRRRWRLAFPAGVRRAGCRRDRSTRRAASG